MERPDLKQALGRLLGPVEPEIGCDECFEQLDRYVELEVAGADAVTFTSSSTVRSFVDALGRDAVPPVVACIGPVTATTARELGVTVTVEAEEHTIPGLVAAVRSALDRRPS